MWQARPFCAAWLVTCWAAWNPSLAHVWNGCGCKLHQRCAEGKSHLFCLVLRLLVQVEGA